MKVRHRESIRREIREVYPALSFWYGLSFKDIFHMPRWAVRMYIGALDQLLAEMEHMMTQAASFPHMKRVAQRSATSALRKRLRAGRPKTYAKRPDAKDSEAKVEIAKADYMKSLAGLGIGFKEVEKRNDA